MNEYTIFEDYDWSYFNEHGFYEIITVDVQTPTRAVVVAQRPNRYRGRVMDMFKLPTDSEQQWIIRSWQDINGELSGRLQFIN